MVYYLTPVNQGIKAAISTGDGYSITIKWWKAYPDSTSNKIAYHIYFSKEQNNVFNENIKYVSIDDSLEATITDLDPGQMYFFAVRAVEYNPNTVDLDGLGDYYNLKIYPISLLRNNITMNDVIIPLVDSIGFPSKGIIQVGVELINYNTNDNLNDNLVLTNFFLQRGFLKTTSSSHTTDGYDGKNYWNPEVSYILGREEMNTRFFSTVCKFDYPFSAYTQLDGYKQEIEDILTTDMTANEEINQGFPMYPFTGYHRIDPVKLLNGECVGSYIGGESYCFNPQTGGSLPIRGLDFQDKNNQREEVLLSLVGRPAVLIKRALTGIICDCYKPTNEYSDDRCPRCYGKKFVMGYQQFFNDRRSDSRILVKLDPADDDLKMTEAGLDPDMIVNAWTLTIPTVKDRDIIILYDNNDNEEFRYEVLKVQRNTVIGGTTYGAQKITMQRIRKTDVAYQIKVFKNTAEMPNRIQTTQTFATGIGFHSHTIVISEKGIEYASQLTSIDSGHNHAVQFNPATGLLEVLPAKGHIHQIIL